MTFSAPDQSDLQDGPDPRAFLYLVGIGVTHSIAPPMHNYIASSLGYPWKFIAQECPTVEDAISLFRKPSFAGGVVTMPYKKSIMPHLDSLDDLAVTLGACNNVYRTADGALRGTNTDWRGIEGCLRKASEGGMRKPAIIIGAGGASRAAVYALCVRLGCPIVYIINRDAQEVSDLVQDTKRLGLQMDIVHVQSVTQAKELPAPFYIVGTVPDFEPQTPSEIEARDILETFLAAPEKGVLLDMCFKPRRTRILKIGVGHGWQDVEGTGVIGFQIKEQYRLWCGGDVCGKIPEEEAWNVLMRAADESEAINY